MGAVLDSPKDIRIWQKGASRKTHKSQEDLET
jgi:hypothetical protein